LPSHVKNIELAYDKLQIALDWRLDH
jgi:hypothetical protein